MRQLRDEHEALVIVDAQQLPVSMIRVADHGLRPLLPPLPHGSFLRKLSQLAWMQRGTTSPQGFDVG